MPSGLHDMWCVGMPPTRVNTFRRTIGRSLTWRLSTHEHDPILTCARPHKLTRTGRLWSCDACTRATVKWARTECVEQMETAVLGTQWRPQCHFLGFLWSCRFGTKAALGELCVRPPREYARSVRLLSGGWCAKGNRFLGSSQLLCAGMGKVTATLPG